MRHNFLRRAAVIAAFATILPAFTAHAADEEPEPDGVAIVTPADGELVPYQRTGIPITVDLTDVYSDDDHMLAVECNYQEYNDLDVFYFDNTGTQKTFTTRLRDPYPGATCEMYGLVGSRFFTIGYPPQKINAFAGNRREFYPERNGYRDKIRIGFTLTAPAEITAEVTRNGRSVRTASIGVREQGVSHWDWDGRTQAGTIAAPGRYDVVLTSTDAAGTQVTSTPVTVTARPGDGATALNAADKIGDAPAAIDVRRLRVTYHVRNLVIGAAIPKLRAAKVASIYVMVDTGRRDDAVYILYADRNRRGKWKPSIVRDQIGDAEPPPTDVKCPGVRVSTGRGEGFSRGLEVRVPAGCLSGDRARVNFMVGTAYDQNWNNDTDYAPNGRYWLPWVDQPY
ncbi:FlgD immunoglobulin-like domain containing protein [Nocardioides sp. SOB77]|uniref:FlgD immunoglobulin-like domain containing protein n=1 Tax=Nocardioides oceani TaxID=3058369 RepID=A0ABT8FCH4_9ACTN|nr:FlgD immunoglobulin-like domain containing protein [Nocardioides oceani]MDN4172387.1 FlgD immunoglobulin-like domain containing protein [Nocardioides oceani]